MTERRLVPLSLLFFASGAAALLFETLWFRLAGLTFGNAAWASAAVLASFMAGLALGNLAALRLRVQALAAPLRVYSVIEAGIGLTGLLLVLALPLSSRVVAPLFRAIGDQPSLVAVTRLTLAFLLMLIPTSLMGATLPTLVGALGTQNFGRTLGLLYGFNTLGAVCGALAGEMVLIEAFGLRGTAVIAFLCSLTAAIGAWMIDVGWVLRPAEEIRGRVGEPAPHFSRAIRFVLAAAMAGFLLLALEIIWMRLLVLFVFATSLAFAVMLAVILLGIGAGALFSAAIGADRYAALVAALASIAVMLTYAGFPAGQIASKDRAGVLLLVSIRLMLPVSFFSGMLFPWIGKQIERVAGEGTLATAVLTAANTLGGMAGSIIATFVLIPRLGIDGAIVLAAVGYIVVAALISSSRVHVLPIAAAIVVIVLAPKNLLQRDFLPTATRDYLSTGSKIIAVEQGPIETAVYLERRAFGGPYIERLYTNGYSMSATTLASKRYMSLFVHLPMALHPSTRSALLISYGVGVTAHALASTPQLTSIDVVDISKTILGLSHIVWPGASNPLRDPRVRVHVEDGRFFLMTTPRRFDLITAEPPPPKCAGVVNLYTKEYFALLRDRLNEGGLATYWLPVYQLEPNEARSVVRAFCDELDDCTLWSGGGGEWILLGSRGPMQPVQSLATPWQTPASADWLSRAGVERPEELGGLFLAGTETLKRWSSSAPPLTDDFPLRLSNRVTASNYNAWKANLDGRHRMEEFTTNPQLRRALPESAFAAAVPYFGVTQELDRTLFDVTHPAPIDPRPVRAILTRSSLRDAPRLLLGSDRWLEDLARAAWARGDRSVDAATIIGIGELSDRHYAEAASLLTKVQRAVPNDRDARTLAELATELAAAKPKM